jgi:hypothetical protein
MSNYQQNSATLSQAFHGSYQGPRAFAGQSLCMGRIAILGICDGIKLGHRALYTQKIFVGYNLQNYGGIRAIDTGSRVSEYIHRSKPPFSISGLLPFPILRYRVLGYQYHSC